MPATPVQFTTETGGASPQTTTAFGSSTTSGNCITVLVYASTTGTPTVTDNKGNTYTARSGRFQSSESGMWIFVAENIVGGASHTVTITETGSQVGAIAREWSGVATASAFDQESDNSGPSDASTSFTSGDTPTTTQADELVYGGVTHPNTNTVSFEAGLTTGTTITPNSNRVADAYKTVSATGAYRIAGTKTAFEAWAAAVVTLKDAGGGGATVGGPIFKGRVISPGRIFGGSVLAA